MDEMYELYLQAELDPDRLETHADWDDLPVDEAMEELL
jgi:hypothetical protein